METTSEPSSPFDFDDDKAMSSERAKRTKKEKWLQWSICTTLGAFFVAIVSSVITNNAVGNLQIEATASAINRFAMVVMLVGCVGIFVAYRAPAFLTVRKSVDHPRSRWSTWRSLFVWNLGGIVLLAVGMFLLALLTQGAGLVFCLIPVPIFLSLMLVVAIWHEGVIRAYAVGFLACVLLHFLFFLTCAWTIPYSVNATFYSPYSTYVSSSFIPIHDVPFVIFVGMNIIAAIAAISGLICSGYVAWLERTRRFQALGNAKGAASEDDLQVPVA